MILAILQARMSSTRLPGKVLRPLAGAPMILRQVERVRRARRIDALVLATSDDLTDHVLADVAEAAGVTVHRGPLDDVLARFIGAMDAFGPCEQVVRLTGDCPLADPELIDAAIALHLESGADYTSNTPDALAYPKGLDVEVVTAAALRDAAGQAASPEAHEHVTWDIWNQPDRYRLAWLVNDADEGDVRWTVDRPDDHAFVAEVYDALYPGNPAFTSHDVRALVRSRPDLVRYGEDRRV